MRVIELNYETVQNKAEICGSSQPEWDEGPKWASHALHGQKYADPWFDWTDLSFQMFKGQMSVWYQALGHFTVSCHVPALFFTCRWFGSGVSAVFLRKVSGLVWSCVFARQVGRTGAAHVTTVCQHHVQLHWDVEVNIHTSVSCQTSKALTFDF